MKPRELEAGEMVGAYRVVRKVGEGGMGDVYEAWDANLDRAVAIKFLNETASQDPDLTERFKGEGRVLARLRHPNVVALFAQGEHHGQPYMVMEFVEGKTVDEFIEYHPIGLTTLVDFYRQMLEGLGAAHAAGIIHRDIKPQNIIVGSDLQIKIIDFGVAKDHSDHLSQQTSANLIMGTAHFFAPEQVLGKMANPQTDLFSLGLVFLYMITGERPFEGKSNLEILEKIRSMEITLGGRYMTLLPAALRNCFSRMLKKNPAFRYRSAKEALDELDAVDLNELPVDLCVNPSPKVTVVNSVESRRLCKDHQLNYLETRMAMNIAIQQQLSATESKLKPDATQVLNPSPALILSEASLREGISRFQSSRSGIITARSMTHDAYVEPPLTRRRASVATPFLLLAIAGVSAYMFSALTPSTRGGATPRAAITVPALKPPAEAKPQVVEGPAAAHPERATAAVTVAEEIVNLPRLKLGTVNHQRMHMFRNGKAVVEIDRQGTLVDNQGGKFFWNMDDGSTNMHLADGFSPISFRTQKREVKIKVNGDPTKIYPLKLGNAVEFEVEFQERDDQTAPASFKFAEKCIVARKEKVVVAAGEFDTFRVECKGQGEPWLIENINYAPKVELIVRREMIDFVNPKLERRVLFETIGYKRAD